MAQVLIVGGSSGIGLATANLFTLRNHEVQSVSRSTQFDYTNEKTVEAFFQTNTQFEQIIISATPPLVLGSFKNTKIQQARANFEKYWGIVTVIQYATHYLKQLNAITLISGSPANKRGFPLTHLATNCTAVNTLTESLAVELAPLRINAVSPGVTDTPLYGERRANLTDFVQTDPLKRVATPEEIAEVIYFVTQNPLMTGAIVACDGGSHLT